jgi:Replication-relaxation
MTTRTTTDHVLRVQHQLADRDWRLLGWLHDHRVLTSFQIAHALFPSLNYAQRRLTKLTDIGLVERFRPFRLQGGSYPYHYALGHAGALIIAAARAVNPPRKADSTARLHRIATSRNLDHRLGINEFFTALAGYEHTQADAKLHVWWPDNRMEGFVPPGTKSLGLPLADGLGVWTEEGRTVAFYFEHDTGTEALAVLVEKIRHYDGFLELRAPAWPALFWLHSTVREAHFHQRLAGIQPVIPVATAARDRLDGLNPADSIWHLHGSASSLLRLAQLPMPGPVDLTTFERARTMTSSVSHRQVAESMRPRRISPGRLPLLGGRRAEVVEWRHGHAFADHSLVILGGVRVEFVGGPGSHRPDREARLEAKADIGLLIAKTLRSKVCDDLFEKPIGELNILEEDLFAASARVPDLDELNGVVLGVGQHQLRKGVVERPSRPSASQRRTDTSLDLVAALADLRQRHTLTRQDLHSADLAIRVRRLRARWRLDISSGWSVGAPIPAPPNCQSSIFCRERRPT